MKKKQRDKQFHLSHTVMLTSLKACKASYQKETSIQMFSCEICKIFRNTFFYRRAPVVVSVSAELKFPYQQFLFFLSFMNTFL